MNENKHVFVAMSGGVDSTVTAVRLMDAGYQVTGIHMETWKDPTWLAVVQDDPNPVSMAAAAAESIGVPFVALDVRERFYQRVVKAFIEQYVAGNTPNPCLFCNPQVKWGILQSYALEQGADYFATGHYARIVPGENGQVQLLRGLDRTKDQSYVLSQLSQQQLQRSQLPLGESTKAQVRQQAKALNLPVADRHDSQDLCFLGDVDYRDFLSRFAPETEAPGEIVDLNGRVLGEHHGLAFYTIGQRRGIRISAPEPYYVVAKEPHSNRLIVGFMDQAGKSSLQATAPNWILGEPPAAGEEVDVMIRYRANPVPVTLASATDDEFRLKFNQPVRGITPGQVAVLYRGEQCLGGGIIKSA
jgi:tRNA-specific 2-thiouridylase